MKENIFDELVLDMVCTEALMPTQEYVVSEANIISRIENIGDLEQTDRDGRTLLINAAFYARKNVVKYLLDRGADVSAKDNSGFTALHAAIKSRNVETIKIILDAGADINAKNEFGNNPIMLCDNATDIEIFKLLIAKGADPLQKNNYGISAKDMFAFSDAITKVLNQG